MTRFSVVLDCGCIVFPESGSRADLDVASAFRGERLKPIQALCLLHGRRGMLASIVNGTGATIGVST